MRVVSRHKTLLNRQVTESVVIEKESSNPECCLNGKSEWGGSKLPKLESITPKGVASQRATKTRQEMAQGERSQGPSTRPQTKA